MQSLLESAKGYFDIAMDFAAQWVLSPASWSQFAMLLLAFLLSRYLNKRFQPALANFLTGTEKNNPLVVKVKDFFRNFLPLLLPLVAYALTAIGEQALAATLGGTAVIALGKRLFLFLALRALVNEIVQDGFLKLLGRVIFIPVGVLYVLGILDLVIDFSNNLVVPLGNLSFSLWDAFRFVAIAGFVFWLGAWSNNQSTTYITSRKEMRPATQQLAAKSAEIAIYGIAFLLVMNIMEADLNKFVVLSGAIGVGLGFGLQKIASNFISGVILLIEGQATVGDFVELDGGEAGTIIKMTARAAILETYDGRWIVVPNEDFITTRVVNYTDSGSANRYEAAFSVSYDTDINLVPEIVEAAVAKHKDVLDKPFPPDCELRAFGESGIDFAVEFWVNGIDDGKNKYTSDVLFLIWNALKDEDIEIPYPQRVVHHKGLPPTS